MQSYGGVLTKDKKDATVFIVDEDSKDNPSTKSIKNNYGSDTTKFIVPYQWIQKSIDAGKPVVLVRFGSVALLFLPLLSFVFFSSSDSSSFSRLRLHRPKHGFTPEEDEMLPKFIAQVIVGQERGTIKEGNQSMKQNGEKMYRYLCSDVSLTILLSPEFMHVFSTDEADSTFSLSLPPVERPSLALVSNPSSLFLEGTLPEQQGSLRSYHSEALPGLEEEREVR